MAEPVTLDEIKMHLDVARDDQDQMLEDMVVAAREWVENYTGLVLVKRQVSEGFDAFDRLSHLTAWPIASDAVASVTYADSQGAPDNVVDARMNVTRRPARLAPAFNTSWPVAYPGSIVVTIEAGYVDAAAVPYSLKAAIKLYVGNLYANRESVVVGTISSVLPLIEDLCRPYRLPVIG